MSTVWAEVSGASSVTGPAGGVTRRADPARPAESAAPVIEHDYQTLLPALLAELAVVDSRLFGNEGTRLSMENGKPAEGDSVSL